MLAGGRRTADGGGHDTGTLGKALSVLDAVAESPRPLRFKDLVELIGQPRGTLHRQITNLIAEGLLSQRDDNCYELGPKLLKLASRAWSDNQFRRIAEPHLAALHDATGETVHLGILNGVEIIYLDKVESRSAVRMHSQIGKASPVYCTGVGKAALSRLPDDRLEALARRIEFKRFTDATIVSPEALVAEIGRIRAEGVSYDREEHEAGIGCVAASIASPDGALIAGISVTAPSYRIGMDVLRGWAPLVRQAADRITEDISTRLGPRV